MLSYNEFEKQFTEQIPFYLPDELKDVEIKPVMVNKINLRHNYLGAYKKGCSHGVTLWLGQFYDEFICTGKLGSIARKAAERIAQEMTGKAPGLAV